MTLLRLQIDNLALIDHAELELGAGLNVFTGETGAGKTMLAQAIGLLAGAAPAAGMVGPHGAETYVEAEFAVPDEFFEQLAPEAVAALRPEGETTLVVARRIAASGRSRALVWGRSCARDDLEQLGELLLEVSSQHEARRLARPATQLDLLDSAAGNDKLRSAMAAAWRELRTAREQLAQAREAAADAERRRGELEELVGRVGEAAIDPGEPVALAQERERLRHLDELVAAIAGAAALVNPEEGDGALSLAARAAELLGDAERYQPELGAGGGRAARLLAAHAGGGDRAARPAGRPRAGARPARARRAAAAPVLGARAPLRHARRRPAGALRGGAGGARPDRHRRTPAGRAGGRPGRGDEPRRSARPPACTRPAARLRSRSRRRSRRSWPTSAWTARGCRCRSSRPSWARAGPTG